MRVSGIMGKGRSEERKGKECELKLALRYAYRLA
jgi:hypothetical protein